MKVPLPELLDYNKVLQDIRYKPNFSYGVYQHQDAWWIRIIMLVEDSRKPFQPWNPEPPEEPNFGSWEVCRRWDPETYVGYSPRRPLVEIRGQYMIPYMYPGDEELFVEWVKRTLHEMEIHELDEWFRYKGELLNDPHKEN